MTSGPSLRVPVSCTSQINAVDFGTIIMKSPGFTSSVFSLCPLLSDTMIKMLSCKTVRAQVAGRGFFVSAAQASIEQTSFQVRRCLLISPLGFYLFHTQLAEGMKRRGYQVDLLNDEFPATTLGRLLGKLALPVLRWLTLRGLRRRLSDCEPYDLAVIIKGRGLSPEAIRFLRTRACRVVGYNFDSFLYNPSPLDWSTLVDRYATFDICDAVKYGVPLVHLFSAVKIPPAARRRYDLSIIQRVHSDRLRYTDLLLRSLPVGTPAFVFLYESNPLTFLIGLMTHFSLYLRLWHYISFRPLPHDQAMQALSLSRVAFDYAHPKQSGITIRCFEAQSLGVAVLTNNSNAVASGLFAPGTIVHLPAQADPKEIAEMVRQLSRRAPAPKTRTLNDFLEDLLADT